MALRRTREQRQGPVVAEAAGILEGTVISPDDTRNWFHRRRNKNAEKRYDRRATIEQAIYEGWSSAELAEALGVGEAQARNLRVEAEQRIEAEAIAQEIGDEYVKSWEDNPRTQWKLRFLYVLRKTHSPTAAAEAVGVTMQIARAEREADLTFQERWSDAITSGLDDLVSAAHKRALSGRPDADGILMFLLRSYKPDVYADRLRLELMQQQVMSDLRQMAEEQGLPVDDVLADAMAIMSTTTPTRGRRG